MKYELKVKYWGDHYCSGVYFILEEDGKEVWESRLYESSELFVKEDFEELVADLRDQEGFYDIRFFISDALHYDEWRVVRQPD